MLTRIRLRGYKSLVDADVRLQPLTVLLGPNAAGKSNFLDALQLLSKLASSRAINAAFDPPYRGTPLETFTLGSEGIRGLLTQGTVSLTIEVDVWLSDAVIAQTNQEALEDFVQSRSVGEDRVLYEPSAKREPPSYVSERTLRYGIELTIQPKSGIVRATRQEFLALDANGKPKGMESSLLTQQEKLWNAQLQNIPADNDSVAKSNSILSWPVSRGMVPHLYALQQELARWSFFYFEPRERMREPNAVRETRRIGMMGENLAPFLNTLQAIDPASFKDLEYSLRTLVPTLTGIDVGVNDRGEVELRLLEGKTPIPASVLSEGTLRLLGLLALGGAKERPTLIGFEEPENGVHPRRIRLIAELLKSYAHFGETQMIVTTHSPVLLDALPRESLYVCRKVAGQTTIRQLSELDPIGRDLGIAAALNGDHDELTVSERMLRGDFDA